MSSAIDLLFNRLERDGEKVLFYQLKLGSQTNTEKGNKMKLLTTDVEIVLCCQCNAKYSAVLCIAVFCITLKCFAVLCIAVQCFALHCFALQCTFFALQCSALQCSAVQHSTDNTYS